MVDVTDILSNVSHNIEVPTHIVSHNIEVPTHIVSADKGMGCCRKKW